jgi:demethylmenaquinone methyltransferase/2-methoxy-6-polyprenyl-1,4-benzoquinol methylase
MPTMPPVDDADLYAPAFVRRLFDEMADTYERVNELTSFGFSRRWRRQAVEHLAPGSGMVVLDAMTGMGEGWPYLARALGAGGQVIAIDLSPGMLAHAAARRARIATPVDLRQGDALASGLADGSVDAVLCLFGLKTLSSAQQTAFAREIGRVLRPGGRASLVEVSVPSSRLLRVPYRFYLRHVIPLLGRLLLGNPANYRLLGVYTDRFRDSRGMADALRTHGLDVELVSYFFGCATGVVARKPVAR